MYLIIILAVKIALFWFPQHFWGEYQAAQDFLSALENREQIRYIVPVAGNQTDKTLLLVDYPTMVEIGKFNSLKYELVNYTPNNADLILSLNLMADTKRIDRPLIFNSGTVMSGSVAFFVPENWDGETYQFSPSIKLDGKVYTYTTRQIETDNLNEVHKVRNKRVFNLVLTIVTFVLWLLILIFVW